MTSSVHDLQAVGREPLLTARPLLSSVAAGLPEGVTCEVDTLSERAWHRLLEEFEDASIMQTCAYAAQRWPRATLSHLVLRQAGQPLAAAQVVVRSIPVLGGGLAYVHFGPLWNPRSGDDDPDGAHLDLAVRCLSAEYQHNRRMMLRVRPWPSRAEDDLLDRVFAGWRCQQEDSPDRFLVNLDQPTEALHKSLNGKWRYNLKRSHRYDLTVEHVALERAYDQFMALYESMRARKGFFDKSAIAELAAIHADLPAALKPDVWLCRSGGRPVAGAVVSHLGDTTQYLFGASNDEALKVNAGYRLHWEIAEWASSRGSRWYDLGGDSGSQGLRQFKSGMVGRSGRIASLPGDFEASTSRLSESVVGAAMACRSLGEKASQLTHRLGR